MNPKLYIPFALLIFLFFPSHAHEKINLTPKWKSFIPEIFVTDDLSITIEDVRKPGFQNANRHNVKKSPVIPNKAYWYKIDFSGINITPDEHWNIRIRNYDEVIFYYQSGDSIKEQKKGKKWISESKHAMYTNFGFETENLIDGHLLYVRMMHNKRTLLFWHVTLNNDIAHELLNTFYTKKAFNEQLFYYIFTGAMFIMIAYFWGIYFMYKDKLYILYLLYLISLFLYLAPKVEIIESLTYTYYEFFFRVFHELIQGVINIFYLLFASAFFKAKTNFPRLYVAIRYMVKILIIIMFVQVIFMFTNKYYYIETYIMQGERFFVMLFSVWAYYHILRNYKDKLVFFLLIGSFFYLLGGIGALLFAQVGYMMLGSLLEVFLFSLGMGYRMKKSEDEKKSIESEIVKVELSALKAQMNPHFIFNSLNSIRAYVISNETKKASGYITKFSKLIRLILYYSSKEYITLKEEMEALQLYVQLEELRYREKFEFKISVDNELNPENVLIPPLIVQPYIENAIRHGLAPKTGEKNVFLTIQKMDDFVEIRIKDNGVGRHFHEKSNSKPVGHNSMAMDLTQRRIQLTSKIYSHKENIIVNDLEEKGKPSGTEVVFHLPLVLLH